MKATWWRTTDEPKFVFGIVEMDTSKERLVDVAFNLIQINNSLNRPKKHEITIRVDAFNRV